LHEIGSNQAQGGLHAVVPSFGERLKKEREKRGMTLEDVSGATKISVRNLRALEQEKFDQMPGGIFNRGFVRAFAKHLGLDDDQVVADYREAAGESVPTLDPPDIPAPGHTSEKVAGPPSSPPPMTPAAIPAPPPPAAPAIRPPTAAPPRAPIVVFGFWLTSAQPVTTRIISVPSATARSLLPYIVKLLLS